MKNANVLIVTEVNHRVASGHFFECLVCYEELKHDTNVYLMVNVDMPAQFRREMPEQCIEYQSNIQEETEVLIRFILEHRIDIVLFNLREIQNEFIHKVRAMTGIGIICIDEFGHRMLEADIIINPMISEKYWVYDSDAEVFCGADYLVLSPEIVEYHKRDKAINEKINMVTVSMGGVDAPGTTLKLAQWLPEILVGADINLVIGGGFTYQKELLKIVENYKQISIYQNIDFLYDLFYQSDLAVCAGGNTLHELAVIGTPALVIPSMPHEFQNGQAFQNKGFSLCCDMAEQINRRKFEQNLWRVWDVEVRTDMTKNGKCIVDGRGSERVCRIVRNYIRKKLKGK